MQEALGSWVCSQCGTMANTGFLQPPAQEGCKGWSVVLKRIGDGHRIVKFAPLPSAPTLPPLYACELCHRASSHKAVFTTDCDGLPTRSRTAALRRVELGRQPHPRKGNEAVYSAGRWVDLR